MECDFCSEIVGAGGSAFQRIYGQDANRVVAESDTLIALPTLGQLFPGSLLVLPKSHIEMFSRAGSDVQSELPHFIEPLLKSASRFGDPLIFEHGALACTGASCGIYHAHLHIVPLPSVVAASELLPEARGRALSLSDAFAELTNASKYLLVGEGHRFFFAADHDIDQLPSQCMRIRLAERFALQQPWDWRAYTSEEPWVGEAIDHYRPHT